MKTVLRVDNLVVRYGQITAVKGISLEVKEGEIVAVLGANGAGKSTTLRTLSGLIRSSSGAIEFDGAHIERMPPAKIVARGLVHCPEGRRIFGRMSVRENLILGHYSARHRIPLNDEMNAMFQLFPILAERASQAGGTLSGGEQQQLALARALMARPRLLLLDEPSLGLAPLLVQRIFEKIAEVNRAGTTILLVEQNANQALRLASRAYVLETGRIVLEGTGQELLANEKVREAYLGGQAQTTTGGNGLHN